MSKAKILRETAQTKGKETSRNYKGITVHFDGDLRFLGNTLNERFVKSNNLSNLFKNCEKTQIRYLHGLHGIQNVNEIPKIIQNSGDEIICMLDSKTVGTYNNYNKENSSNNKLYNYNNYMDCFNEDISFVYIQSTWGSWKVSFQLKLMTNNKSYYLIIPLKKALELRNKRHIDSLGYTNDEKVFLSLTKYRVE